MPRKGPSMTFPERAARRKAVAEAVRGGMPLAQASARFGLDDKDVRRACIEHGLRFGRGGNIGAVAAKERRLQPMLRAARGRTARDLAVAFGLLAENVRSACENRGIRLAKAKRGAWADVLDIRRALAQHLARTGRLPGRVPDSATGRRVAGLLLGTDLAVTRIGERCGVTHQYVCLILKGMRGGMETGESGRSARAVLTASAR